MANEYTSADLLASLNETVINQAFEIARSNRTGILATIGMGMSRPAEEGYKLSWLDGYQGADSSDTNGAVLVGDLTITVDDGSLFRAGMLISATGSEEVIFVASVAANVLTVERAFGGTTAEAIDDNVTLTIDSVGRAENSTAENDTIWTPETTGNYFQTIDTGLSFSRRALATMQYGDTNNLVFQLAQKMEQLAIKTDRMIIRGRKATRGTGDDMITYTGGLRYFISQAGTTLNIDESGAALTLDMIDDVNAEIVRAGGNANYIACGIDKAREINTLMAAKYGSTRLAEYTADQGSVTRLPSDLPIVGNIVNIVVDTNLDASEVVIYDSTKLALIPMGANNAESDGNWRKLDATTPGKDGIAVRILGDFGLEMRQSKANFGRLYNLA